MVCVLVLVKQYVSRFVGIVESGSLERVLERMDNEVWCECFALRRCRLVAIGVFQEYLLLEELMTEIGVKLFVCLYSL